MKAFDVGVLDGMEKTGGIKSWLKAPVETYKALRSTGAKPMGRLSAALQTAQKRKGQVAAAGGALGAAGIGGAYAAGKMRRKEAAAGNPAQPVKSSLGTGAPEKQRFAPYLNLGGGQAGEHKTGPIEDKPQPWPGHVNIGDKGAGQQVAGAVAMDKSPDSGERGSAGGDMVRTKSAAFLAGIDAVLGDDGDE